MNKSLKITISFFVLLVITCIFGTSGFPVGVRLDNIHGEDLGGISINPLGYIVGILFIFLVHKFYQSFHFGFTLKKSIISLPLIFPIIVSILLNFITSTSLHLLLHEMSGTFIFLAIILSLIGAISVGFIEELIFRSGFFNLFIYLFKDNKFYILISGILSSLFFGAYHFVNLLSGAAFIPTLGQTIYATAIGFFLSMTYVKYQSLIVPIFIHAIIDWSDYLLNFSGEPKLNTFETFIMAIFISIVFVICGAIIYRKIDTTNNYLGFQEKTD